MRHDALSEFDVFKHELLLAPRQVRVRLLERIEEFLRDVGSDKTYPLDFIQFRITGHRSESAAPFTLSSSETSVALARLLDEAGRTVKVTAASIEEPVFTVSELARRWKISTATVMRWRKAGLAGRLFDFGTGRRKVGIRKSLAERWERDRSRLIRRARLRRRLTKAERMEIREAALVALAREEAPAAVMSALSEKFTLSQAKLARFLGDASREAPALHALTRTSISQRERMEIFSKVSSGDGIGTVAAAFGRSSENVRRIWSQGRARVILRRRLKVVWNEEFDSADARGDIMDAFSVGRPGTLDRHSGPAGHGKEVVSLPVLSREDERGLFRKYNYVKYIARELRKDLRQKSPDAALLGRIETLLAEADRLRDIIVRSNLRLVMSIAKRHYGRKTSFPALTSDGNMALLDAVETFDYGRGNRFSTYAGWAIVRRFARTVPEENYRIGSIDEEVLETVARVEVDYTATKPAELVAGIAEALTRLPEREREVLEGRFGLGKSDKPRTLAEIGALFGVTKERIRQIEVQAIARLRKIVETTAPELVP